jgi:F-type H+-transporting ATPase subunit a
MLRSRTVISALFLLLICCTAAWAQNTETTSPATPNSVSSPIAPASGQGTIRPVTARWLAAKQTNESTPPAAAETAKPATGEPAEEKPEHWTFFLLLPMGWTFDLAEKIAPLFGTEPDKAKYTAERLQHVLIMFFVVTLLSIMAVVLGGHYRKLLAQDNPAPSPNVSLANFMEMIVNTVLGLMQEVIGGHNTEKYLPLVGTLAIVILFNNLLGLIPGFHTATDTLMTNAAMALTVFCIYHYYGVKTHGVGKYLAHFMGPLEGKMKYILAPLMVPIELISDIVRPVSLSLRLMGNMIGDHRVFLVFMSLAPIPLLYPIPFLALGLLVAIVQTLVFCLLTMVYIGLATAKEH